MIDRIYFKKVDYIFVLVLLTLCFTIIGCKDSSNSSTKTPTQPIENMDDNDEVNWHFTKLESSGLTHTWGNKSSQ